MNSTGKEILSSPNPLVTFQLSALLYLTLFVALIHSLSYLRIQQDILARRKDKTKVTNHTPHHTTPLYTTLHHTTPLHITPLHSTPLSTLPTPLLTSLRTTPHHFAPHKMKGYFESVEQRRDETASKMKETIWTGSGATKNADPLSAWKQARSEGKIKKLGYVLTYS
jgi:hypothetical protein